MVTAFLAALALAGAPAAPADDGEAVGRTLDALHAAASAADGERYFELFAPDAVFLGTDVTERWPLAEFRVYAEQRFRTGRGWTYAVVERHVVIGPEARTAWFDETLTNARYGTCRGTGVLVADGAGWKIAQYALTIPVPNEVALDVVAMIRSAEAPADPEPAP